jgi:hypothetical protein
VTKGADFQGVNRQGIGLDAALRSGSVGGTERGCSSAVERQLPKLNVVGSIPITRSILYSCCPTSQVVQHELDSSVVVDLTR